MEKEGIEGRDEGSRIPKLYCLRVRLNMKQNRGMTRRASPYMARAVKVRVPVLNKDVTFLRLTTSEIKAKFHDVTIDVATLLDDQTPTPAEDDRPPGLLSDGPGSDIYSVELEVYNYGTASAVLTIAACTKDFDTKVAPLLHDLDDSDLRDVVFELYREAILINPSLDYVAAAIYGASEPLSDDLLRLVDLLPSEICSPVVAHIFRYAITDRLLMDEVISGERILDVPDEAVELVEETELTLDMERVRALPAELSSRMIGQQHAIQHITGVARRVAVGFRDPSRPPAVVMCVGPTGVGKTMLAKETSNILFGDKAFGRIDCAQIAEKHGTSKLLGAPPGYVGYPSGRGKEGEDVRKLDPSLFYKETQGMVDGGILLFDEIEKADPDVLDVLLTAFDEGYVKTSVGNVIDLRNVVIMITSNLGARELQWARESNKLPLGFGTAKVEACSTTMDVSEIKSTTMEAIKAWMKPELLSRITSVLPFMELTKEEMRQVVDLEWKKAATYVKEKLPADIIISDGLKDLISEKSMDRGSGARYVGRLVDAYITDTLAALFVETDEAYAAKEIMLTVETGGECDVVIANYDGENYEHKVTMTLGD